MLTTIQAFEPCVWADTVTSGCFSLIFMLSRPHLTSSLGTHFPPSTLP
jgi:hypothetical protein